VSPARCGAFRASQKAQFVKSAPLASCSVTVTRWRVALVFANSQIAAQRWSCAPAVPVDCAMRGAGHQGRRL
jgi:hypothetical protein